MIDKNVISKQGLTFNILGTKTSVHPLEGTRLIPSDSVLGLRHHAAIRISLGDHAHICADSRKTGKVMG